MKKHNFFLNFLKRIFYLFIYSNISNILGIKLKIKGRFNGSLRSKTRIIKLGNISLQSFQSDLLYKNDTVFTKYGTIGIKIWIIKNINVTST
jgi:ribosomal protein S3